MSSGHPECARCYSRRTVSSRRPLPFMQRPRLRVRRKSSLYFNWSCLNIVQLSTAHVQSNLITHHRCDGVPLIERSGFTNRWRSQRRPCPMREAIDLGDVQRGGVKSIVARHFCCSVCGCRGVSAWPIWPRGRTTKGPRGTCPRCRRWIDIERCSRLRR